MMQFGDRQTPADRHCWELGESRRPEKGGECRQDACSRAIICPHKKMQ
jgi:hypothetical protein